MRLARPLAPLAVLLVAACGADSATGADSALRREASTAVSVTVDSVVGAFDPRGITWAAFTVRNAAAAEAWVASCIEGTAAALERNDGGAWTRVGQSMCWGTRARDGVRLAAGAHTGGELQVPAPGRYRLLVPVAVGAGDEQAIASAEFDAR